MSEQPTVCPHCLLPARLPDICTPDIHEVIERKLARDWELYNAGYMAGKKAALADRQEQGAQ